MTKGKSLCHIKFRCFEIVSVAFLPFWRNFASKTGENPRSIYADGAVCALANLQLLEHSDATFEHVAVGGIEIAGIPGIGHVAGAIGPIEQARDLAIGVLAKDTV